MGENRRVASRNLEKAREAEDKSAQLHDSSMSFAEKAKMLRKRQEANSSWFGGFF
jgi:hypothetical protein